MRGDWGNAVRPRTKIVAAVLVAVVTTVGFAAVWLATLPGYPSWRGEGDWRACAEVAGVSPEEALAVVAVDLGYSRIDLLSYTATVTPAFLNRTGAYYEVACPGGVPQRQAYVGQSPTHDPSGPDLDQDYYAWRITMDRSGPMATGCINMQFVNWPYQGPSAPARVSGTRGC